MFQRAVKIAIGAFLLVIVAGFRIPAAKADSNNLIPNPSVEIANAAGQPQDWQTGGWGNNQATFAYQSTGQDGSHSLAVKVTNYRSGDAKWYFTPVTVQAGTRYIYTDYYKSSVASQLVAQVTHTDNSVTYLNIGSLSQSGSWKRAAFAFTTPADASQLTVFHLLQSNGTLQTDNFSLHLPTDPIITNNVPNASLEQADDLNLNQPLAWSTNSWGQNSPVFTYLNNGHTGQHSVKTELTAYTNGDAKWYYQPQPVTAGQHYRFTDYYKANVVTHVVAAIGTANGTTYISLDDAPASTGWSQYRANLVVPADGQTVTIFHLISAVGFLITDDYGLQAIPSSFKRGLVSFTFDDGWETDYTTAFPLLTQYQAPSTQYLVTSFLGMAEYMSVDEVRALQAAGHEIGSHTITHPDLTTLTDAQLKNELGGSQKFLVNTFGGPVTDFASPYGAYDTRTVSFIKKYYRSHRSSDLGFNTYDNFNIYNIRIQSVESTVTPAELDGWIQQATQEKSWLVLLFHRVSNDNLGQYNCTPAVLEAALQSTQAHQLPAVTVNQALNELTPQL